MLYPTKAKAGYNTMKKNHDHIGSEAAKKAVLAYNHIRREDAEFTFCQLEHDAQGELYHLIFDACMLCYECYVDAKTLEVRGVFSAPTNIYAESIAETSMFFCA